MDVKNIKKIAVIGAGIMGQGVAYQFAKYGYPIELIDISGQQLENAKLNIKNTERLDKLLHKSGSTVNVLDLINFSTDLSSTALCDYIIENIVEYIKSKEKLYQELANIIKKEAVLAVNTSAISVTKLAAFLPHPENVLGIHFMNPVHLKPTVEVIKAVHTHQNTLALTYNLLDAVKMEGIEVNDSPGFVSNRVLMLTINEAIFALQDQVSSAASIDKIFTKCFGHTMGPLATSDLIGNDTILYTLEVLLESFNDPKFRPAPLLRKMVDAGYLGRKSGKGFFEYK